MPRLFISLFFFLQFICDAVSQHRYTLTQQKDFSSYLFEKHLYANCNLLLNEVEKNYVLNSIQRDSIDLLHAICFSKLEWNDSAAIRFARVSAASPDHYFSGFNASLKLVEMNKSSISKELLMKYQPTDTMQKQLKEFYLSSLFLLNKEIDLLDAQISKTVIGTDFFGMRNQELKNYESRIRKANKKSALLAGLLSTVVPGTGKIYSGKWRQGLISMIPLTLMGLQTYEAYRIEGIKSARFIVFGGLFSVFYIGNIYGSAVSVSVRKTEIEHEVHDQVVLSLRMSLQHVFGKSY